MKLTIIGSAGSFPAPGSSASCYLVEAEEADGRAWRVLLDLGNGSLGPMQKAVGLHDLDAILLSHLHPDHCMDLCGLYVALRYDPLVKLARRVPVYGPSGTLERLIRAYGTEAAGHLDLVYEVHEWTSGTPLRLGPLMVTPLLVNHPVETYGLRVEQVMPPEEPGGEPRTAVLAYSGDSDSCPGLVAVARGADVFLCEASFQEGRDTVRGVHLTGLRAGQAAAEAGVARLLLTHLPAWNDPATVLAEARSMYSGRIDLAKPGDVHMI